MAAPDSEGEVLKVLEVSKIDFSVEHHMEQIKFEGHTQCPVIPMSKMRRILEADAPRKPYSRPPNSERSVNHWGQRKLLLSEIEFLTLHGRAGCLVVYAGAAPGTHTNYLSDLFPNMDFLLVDPSEFLCKPTPRIEIRKEFFTEEICREVREQNRDVLFISDIRTADPKVLSAEEVEKAVKEDMRLQMAWVLELKPRSSMLKFRLPWDAGKTTYLKGDIYLPVWGRETTTECRLITPEGGALCEYDNRQYEEQMFFFNRVARCYYYDHGYSATDIPGLDHCYDCAAELFILEKYLSSPFAPESSLSLRERVIEMSIDMNAHCSRAGTIPRTLKYRETATQRKQWFAPKKFDYASRTMVITERRQSGPGGYDKKRRRSDDYDFNRRRGRDGYDRDGYDRDGYDYDRRRDRGKDFDRLLNSRDDRSRRDDRDDSYQSDQPPRKYEESGRKLLEPQEEERRRARLERFAPQSKGAVLAEDSNLLNSDVTATGENTRKRNAENEIEITAERPMKKPRIDDPDLSQS